MGDRLLGGVPPAGDSAFERRLDDLLQRLPDEELERVADPARGTSVLRWHRGEQLTARLAAEVLRLRGRPLPAKEEMRDDG